MAASFEVEVVAADHTVYHGQAVSLTLPGASGYLGVLRGHAPLITALGIGEITIKPAEGGAEVLIAVSGGFAEVLPEHSIILADTAETVDQIDTERARLAKERAEARLRLPNPETDIDRARAALARAINRLRVVGRGGQ